MSFADLDNKMSKISPKGSILSKNAFSRVDEWINTGNYMFNAQLSGSIFGGFPNSRSVMLSGDPGTGKTFLALNACREAQKIGYEIIYCDTEAAVDEEVMVKFGIDPDRVRYQPIATVSEMRNFASNLIVTIKEAIDKGLEVPKLMIVLDSLGNMATTKEKTDAASGHMAKDMTKQGELRSMFRVLTTDLAEFKIPFIITNHTYQGFGMFATKEISGGGGAKFNASIVTMLGKSKLDEGNSKAKEAEMKQTGIIVTSRIVKNRFARPIPVRFHISFFNGMNPYTGLEKYITWESCGIERGKVFNQKEIDKDFPKWTDAQKKNHGIETFEEYKDKYGWVSADGENLYFYRMGTARSIAVRHLDKQIPPSELFTPSVMTDKVLHEIDEKLIKPLFKLPEIGGMYDIKELSEIADVVDAATIIEDEEND